MFDGSAGASVTGSVAVVSVVGVTGWVAGGAEVSVGSDDGWVGGAAISVGLGAGDPHPAASVTINGRRMRRVTVSEIWLVMRRLFFMRQV